MGLWSWFFEEKGSHVKRESLSVKLINKVISLIKLSNIVKIKNQELEELDLTMALEKKNELFIYFSDFLELLETSDLKMESVLKRCKHVSELDPSRSSVVEIDTFIENDHVILCHDKENCQKHKDLVSTKLRISSIRK